MPENSALPFAILFYTKLKLSIIDKQAIFLTTLISHIHNLTVDYGVSSLCLKSRTTVNAVSHS
jgi:hypothetical protein